MQLDCSEFIKSAVKELVHSPMLSSSCQILAETPRASQKTARACRMCLGNEAEAMDHQGEVVVAAGSCTLDDSEASSAGLSAVGYFRVTVSDNGPGMTGDVKVQAFDPFFIPHQWHTRNELARFEGYYVSVFYSCFAASGLDVEVEDSSNLGRVYMAVRTPQRVWLFEFKIAEASQPGEGLRQMRERGYADKHRSEDVEVILAAVDISRKTRNITAFTTVAA